MIVVISRSSRAGSGQVTLGGPSSATFPAGFERAERAIVEFDHASALRRFFIFFYTFKESRTALLSAPQTLA